MIDVRPVWGRRLELIGFPLLALALAAALYFPVDRLRDLDGLWHLAHAGVYATRGLGYAEFPWATASVVREYAADDWYGFHLLLIPFTSVADPLLRVRIAGTFLAFAAFLILWGATRLLRIWAAPLWPLLMVLGSTATANRYGMVRPHVLSNALALLLLPVLAYGRPWHAALLAALFSFLHFNVFWLLPLVTGTYGLISYLLTRQFPWQRFAAVVLGETLGWLLRPHPWGAASLVYVQTVTWAQTHLRGVALETPRELQPMPLSFLVSNFTPVLLVWLTALAVWLWLAWRRPAGLAEPRRTLLWTSLTLSLLFFEMTVNLAARACDHWVAFGFAFVGLLLTARMPSPGWLGCFGRRRSAGSVLASVLVLLGAANAAWSLHSSNLAVAQYMPNPYRLRPACEYLRTHAPPGAVVFSPQWGLFPELFFWNPANYYIGGMDPIFQYVYSPDLFYKVAHLNEGDGSRTCGLPECAPAQSEDTYTVLQRDFHARYLLTSRRWDAPLAGFALRDPRFTLRFADAEFLVFELAP